jgi:sulfate transporter 4
MSAVAATSGAKSQISGVISAFLVMFVLLFLTPVFAKVPYNVIAAVTIASCLQLVEYETGWYLFKVSASNTDN